MKTIEQIQAEIEKHEKAIELLEAIQSLYRKIKLLNELINGFGGCFPSLKIKYLNDIDTIYRAINRLNDRYAKFLQTLNK